MYKKNLGFTLMEMMVVVAIVGVLLAIALPNYQRSVIRNNRADMEAELMQLAGLLEQYKARQFGYAGANFLALGRTTTAVTVMNFPRTGTSTYSVTLTPVAGSWTLRAVPLNRQLAANDGVLALDSLGRQCWESGNSTTTGCEVTAGSTDLGNPTNAWSVTR